jgi:translation initiation factor 1
MHMSGGRIVYSTGVGKVCPTCGWPSRECKCSVKQNGHAALPTRIVVKLRLEKAGRGGKTMTVLYDLPDNTECLTDLARELKRACGTGGAVAGNTVELQGDLRQRVRDHLEKKGWQIKG